MRCWQQLLLAPEPTIIGMVPPIVNHSKTLRERYGIPKENNVITSLILGHPKYKYRKSIRRDLAGVRTVRAKHGNN